MQASKKFQKFLPGRMIIDLTDTDTTTKIDTVWRETLAQQKFGEWPKICQIFPSKLLLCLIASHDELNGMLILNYFKCVPVESTTDEQLPEPSGPWSSKSLPTNAVELANTEVLKLDTAHGSRTGLYLMLTLDHRYEVGKRAAEHGVTAFIRYFAKK